MDDLDIIVPIYNEESRIESFIQNLPSSANIIFLDKSSTDESVKIASKYKNVKIITLPYGPPSSEHEYWHVIRSQSTAEWYFIMVISQKIDKTLYDEIIKQTKSKNIDIIEIPFRNYTLNLASSYNPWPNNTFKKLICRKSVVNFQNKVHNELHFLSDKVKRIPNSYGYIKHFSNNTTEKLISKSIMYASQELLEYKKNGLVHPIRKSPLKFIFKSFFNGYIRHKGTIFRGQKGALLGSAYVVTQLLILVFVLGDLENNE